MEIRPAREADRPGIVTIYNHFIVNSHVTFDTRPFTVEQRRAWFDVFTTSSRYRLLVADAAGACAGYSSSHPFRHKPAYDTSVEVTVYVHPDYIGQGLGRRLYGALFDVLSGEALHRAYAGIALPNDASVALHEAFGFHRVGTYREVGYKFGRYWDVSWYERPLGR